VSSASAFAPASIGNVAVGFDILGQSIAGIGDRATVRRIDEPLVRIDAIRGCVRDLPTEASLNTAGRALMALREAHRLPFGFGIELDKGIALGSGMGGSAASCVAALIAANTLLDQPLAIEALYPFALEGAAGMATMSDRYCSADSCSPRTVACCASRYRRHGIASWFTRTPYLKHDVPAKCFKRPTVSPSLSNKVRVLRWS
jgi:hypothetical protein